MLFTRLLSIATLAVLSTGTAIADKWDIPVTFEGTISSPKGKSYARDYLKVYGGCYAGDPEFPAKLDRAERELAKLDHAGDRALFAAYWTKVRAYIKPHMVGIAGLGTYAELRARVDGLSARLETDLPPVGTDPTVTVVEMATRAKLVRETTALKEKIIEASPCLHFTGNWSRFQNATNKSNDATSEIFYKSGLEKLADQYLAWQRKLAILDVAPPSTWEKHNAYTYDFVRFTGETQRLLPQAKTIASFRAAGEVEHRGRGEVPRAPRRDQARRRQPEAERGTHRAREEDAGRLQAIVRDDPDRPTRRHGERFLGAAARQDRSVAACRQRLQGVARRSARSRQVPGLLRVVRHARTGVDRDLRDAVAAGHRPHGHLLDRDVELLQLQRRQPVRDSAEQVVPRG
jgi:hypothetical protein